MWSDVRYSHRREGGYRGQVEDLRIRVQGSSFEVGWKREGGKTMVLTLILRFLDGGLSESSVNCSCSVGIEICPALASARNG